VLDIGGAWVPGAPVRSLYHFQVAVALVKDDWKLAQDFYWHNPARLPSPAEWVNVRRVRVKDAVNMVWWFSKTDNPKADNRRVLQPYSESMKSLLKNGYKAKMRPSGHDISDNFSRDEQDEIPSNLLVIGDGELDAAYLQRCEAREIKPPPTRLPEGLVRFFLNLLTDEGDLVVDPFGGSNATGAACEFRRRRWLTCDIEQTPLEGSTVRFDD
jgi:DNA modification methylase